ncbi:hypothetical protein GGR57DRAFT_516309 [Xylariaceae sp. FL1272]|nr:hypothetical protein GGR57DRAFT_516309 [Xylariaceae sp. FL1272]
MPASSPEPEETGAGPWSNMGYLEAQVLDLSTRIADGKALLGSMHDVSKAASLRDDLTSLIIKQADAQVLLSTMKAHKDHNEFVLAGKEEIEELFLHREAIEELEPEKSGQFNVSAITDELKALRKKMRNLQKDMTALKAGGQSSTSTTAAQEKNQPSPSISTPSGPKTANSSRSPRQRRLQGPSVGTETRRDSARKRSRYVDSESEPSASEPVTRRTSRRLLEQRDAEICSRCSGWMWMTSDTSTTCERCGKRQHKDCLETFELILYQERVYLCAECERYQEEMIGAIHDFIDQHRKEIPSTESVMSFYHRHQDAVGGDELS